MINNNIFEPKDIGFFHDKFDEIESFEILNNSRNSKKVRGTSRSGYVIPAGRPSRKLQAVPGEGFSRAVAP